MLSMPPRRQRRVVLRTGRKVMRQSAFDLWATEAPPATPARSGRLAGLFRGRMESRRSYFEPSAVEDPARRGIGRGWTRRFLPPSTCPPPTRLALDLEPEGWNSRILVSWSQRAWVRPGGSAGTG